MPGPDVAELERSIQEALCCPDGCLRRDSDCWIRLGRYGAKKSVPVIMQIIARTLAQSQERDAEIRRAAIEECAKPIKEKIEQLIAYLPSCEGDSEIKRHARAFADGRFAQAQMDLDRIRALATDEEVKT